MGTFAFIQSSQSAGAVVYTVEDNSLVTESGTYCFQSIQNSGDSEIQRTVLQECGPFLLVYASACYEQLGAAAATFGKLLEVAEPQNLEVSVSEIEWNEFIDLDESGYHLASVGPTPTLSQCLNTLRLPMKKGIRVTQVDQLPFIFELNLEFSDVNDLHMGFVVQVLEALVAGADYVPYRNTAMTKLLWRSMSRHSETLCSLFFFSMEELNPTTQLLLKMAHLLTKLHDLHTSGQGQNYAMPTMGVSLESIASSETKMQALKDEVRASVRFIMSIQRQEAERVKKEADQRQREEETKAKRAMNAQIRSKQDEINAAKRELRQVEIENLIISQRNELADMINESPGLSQENWFDGEIKRKKGLLAEMNAQERYLKAAIKTECEFQLHEPFLSLVRQAEHNKRWLSRESTAKQLGASPSKTTLNVP